MQKFLDEVRDFIYDSIDYIIMIGIIGLVVFIIGWRLDLLFAKDADDIIPNGNIIVQNEKGNDTKSSDSIVPDKKKDDINEGETSEPVVNDNLAEKSDDIEKTKEPEKSKDQVKDSSNNKAITVTIPPGSNLSNIATILESNKVISSKSDFINKSEEMKVATKLKAGNYEINSGSPVEEILKILTK